MGRRSHDPVDAPDARWSGFRRCAAWSFISFRGPPPNENQAAPSVVHLARHCSVKVPNLQHDDWVGKSGRLRIGTTLSSSAMGASSPQRCDLAHSIRDGDFGRGLACSIGRVDGGRFGDLGDAFGLRMGAGAALAASVMGRAW